MSVKVSLTVTHECEQSLVHSINVACCRGVIFEDSFCDAVLSVRADISAGDGAECSFMAVNVAKNAGRAEVVGQYGVMDLDRVRPCIFL